MPASVEDRMKKLGFPAPKHPATVPDEASKPEMAKSKPKPVAERKSADKSKSTSSREKG